MNTHVRQTDRESGASVKFTREIRLWEIITVVGSMFTVIAGAAISVYYGQIRLAESQSRLGDGVDRMTVQLQSLSVEIGKLNVTQATTLVQLADGQRRLQILEDQVSDLRAKGPR